MLKIKSLQQRLMLFLLLPVAALLLGMLATLGLTRVIGFLRRESD